MKKLFACGKKGIALLVLAFTVVMGTAMFAACTPIYDDCEHEWQPATCIEARTCNKCGKTIGEALGHKLGEWTINTEPTCTHTGKRSAVCVTCGSTVTYTMPLLSHSYDEDTWVVTPATCAQEGSRTNVCTNCSEEVTETIAKLAHTPGEVWIEDEAATCTKEGSEHTECTECHGIAETREIAKLAHTFDKEESADKYLKNAATCTGAAVYYKSCVACGEKGTATFEVGEPLGHQESTKKTDKAATCTEEGAWYTECTVCHVHVNTGKIEKIAHVYDKEVAGKDYLKSTATCTKAAVYYKSCVCGKKTEDATDAGLFNYGKPNGHVEKDVIDAPATCENDGSKHVVCETCGDTVESDIVIDAIGHDFTKSDDNKVVVVATKASGGHGHTEYKCLHEGCTAVEIDEATEYYMGDNASFGLEYTIKGKTCTVKGIGTCTDTALVIPAYNEDGLKVVGIDAQAFLKNTSIISVKIGANVETIGDSAFGRCTALTTVTAGESLTEVAAHAFIGCTALESFVAPAVTEIGAYAFYGCTSLRTISLDTTSALNIGVFAFDDCPGSING